VKSVQLLDKSVWNGQLLSMKCKSEGVMKDESVDIVQTDWHVSDKTNVTKNESR